MGTHHGVKRVSRPRKGCAAIKADAGPHQIKMIVWAEKDAARICKARPCLRKAGAKPLHQRAEAGKLLPVLRVVAVIRTGEMAHDERDFHALRQRWITGDARGVFGTDAEPVHTRVKVES